MDMSRAFSASDRVNPEVETQIGEYMQTWCKPSHTFDSDTFNVPTYCKPRTERALSYIREHPDSTCREIADAIDTGATSFASLLSRMVKRGVLEVSGRRMTVPSGKYPREYRAVDND